MASGVQPRLGTIPSVDNLDGISPQCNDATCRKTKIVFSLFLLLASCALIAWGASSVVTNDKIGGGTLIGFGILGLAVTACCNATKHEENDLEQSSALE